MSLSNLPARENVIDDDVAFQQVLYFFKSCSNRYRTSIRSCFLLLALGFTLLITVFIISPCFLLCAKRAWAESAVPAPHLVDGDDGLPHGGRHMWVDLQDHRLGCMQCLGKRGETGGHTHTGEAHTDKWAAQSCRQSEVNHAGQQPRHRGHTSMHTHAHTPDCTPLCSAARHAHAYPHPHPHTCGCLLPPDTNRHRIYAADYRKGKRAPPRQLT